MSIITPGWLVEEEPYEEKVQRACQLELQDYTTSMILFPRVEKLVWFLAETHCFAFKASVTPNPY